MPIHSLPIRCELFWRGAGFSIKRISGNLDIPADNEIWQERASTILKWLLSNNRIRVHTAPDYLLSRENFANFPIISHAIPVGRAGLLRRAVDDNGYRVAFNAGYFLLEQDDFISHHSALGDPYNLYISDSVIGRPPLYKRAVFACDDAGHYFIMQIGMDDLNIHLADDCVLSGTGDNNHFAVNPSSSEAIAVYTRYYGVEASDKPQGYTSLEADRIEFTVIDREIVSWKSGGNLEIPQNGFVLSFSKSQMPDSTVQSLIDNRQIDYSLSSQFPGIVHAIQCGPALIQNGEIVLEDGIFVAEQFWRSRIINGEYIAGVVPTDYPVDIDKTRSGRVGIGIKADGRLVVVAVSGVNYGFALDNTDSSGATLMELASYLKKRGAISAINLDGGGSTQLFLEGGAMTRPGDRRGLPGIVYDRMIPAAGVVS